VKIKISCKAVEIKSSLKQPLLFQIALALSLPFSLSLSLLLALSLSLSFLKNNVLVFCLALLFSTDFGGFYNISPLSILIPYRRLPVPMSHSLYLSLKQTKWQVFSSGGANTSTRLFGIGLVLGPTIPLLGLDAGQGRLGHLLVLAGQLGQLVGNGQVQFGDRTSAEIGAGVPQLLELVQRVQAEEVAVDFRIRKIVARDVRQRGESLVDVVVLRMVDNVVSDALLVAEQRLVVVERVQVAVHHLGVVAHAHL